MPATPSVAALAAAEPEDIEAIVKLLRTGHPRHGIFCLHAHAADKYNCQVPTTFEEPLALPGVAARAPT